MLTKINNIMKNIKYFMKKLMNQNKLKQFKSKIQYKMINNKLMNKIIMFKKKKRLYKLNYPSLKKNRLGFFDTMSNR